MFSSTDRELQNQDETSAQIGQDDGLKILNGKACISLSAIGKTNFPCRSKMIRIENVLMRNDHR